ncbi:hypothetical protein Hanom_Chr10g00920831 [Helianthus anomalus]
MQTYKTTRDKISETITYNKVHPMQQPQPFLPSLQGLAFPAFQFLVYRLSLALSTPENIIYYF